MAGRLEEIDFSTLKEQKKSNQSSLSDFSNDNTTYVAVVSMPRGGIEEIVDEVWPELGMPQWALKKFLATRAGYRTNSAVDDPHNKAYDDVNLNGIFQSHLFNDDDASRRLNEAVERLMSGENITLVCYEKDGEKCHRHYLINLLSQRVERRESCKFTLSA